MKKLLRISFLLAVLCLALPVYAEEGDMPTGTKSCTQNCGNNGGGGLYDGSNNNPTDSDETQSDGVNQDESTINEFYSWIYEQISEIVN